MKILTKDVYYHHSKEGVKRLWHNCQKYKKDQQRRVELMPAHPPKADVIDYECGHCGFVYSLDNHLVLAKSG